MSAANGSFLIAGVGERSLVLVADHEKEGRSKMVPIPRGSESAQVDLVLEPSGSLEGKITRDGKPVGQIMVLANPQAAVRGNYIVTSGADGTYKFERLTPDAYVVSSMKTAQNMMGGDLTTKRVVIEAGKTVKLDIALPREGVTVNVKIVPPVATAQVVLLSGKVQVNSPDQLNEAFAERGDGTMSINLATSAKPASFENVQPGDHTLCVIPIPGDLNDPAQVAKIMEQGEDLPLVCELEVVRPAPATQELTVSSVAR